MLFRNGIAPALALFLVTSSTNSCNSSSSSSSIGPSGGEVAAAIAGAAAVVVGAVVLVEVNHSHHNLKGCVASTPDGLRIIGADRHTYAVTGATGALKVGDQVRLHGSKQKEKGTDERTFVVQKISKNYGPCKAAIPQTTAASGTP